MHTSKIYTNTLSWDNGASSFCKTSKCTENTANKTTKSLTTGTKESSDLSNYKPYFSECALSNTYPCAPVHCFNCLEKNPLSHTLASLGEADSTNMQWMLIIQCTYPKTLRYYDDKCSVRAHIKNNRTTHTARVWQSWNKLKAGTASKH